MKIEFSKMEEKITPSFLGGEKSFAVKSFIDDKNKIMLARLIPGASIGMHTHTINAEILYVLSGEGKMLTNYGEETLKVGDCHYCSKGEAHSFRNDGTEDLVFFAVVPVQ